MQLLQRVGYSNVDVVHDASSALVKIRTKVYGLVIADWHMEPITGLELLNEVRADPSLAKTPFIIVTAESRTDYPIKAVQAKASGFIKKPFDAATLKMKIEKALRA